MVVDVTNKSSIPYHIHITQCDHLKPEQKEVTLSPMSQTTLFLNGDDIKSPQYTLRASIKNAFNTEKKPLEYTFRLRGMDYMVGTESQNMYNIIPAPRSLEEKQGKFIFNKETRIILKDKNAEAPLRFLTDRLTRIAQLPLKIQNSTKNIVVDSPSCTYLIRSSRAS